MDRITAAAIHKDTRMGRMGQGLGDGDRGGFKL
jgi:hypothetical protein